MEVFTKNRLNVEIKRSVKGLPDSKPSSGGILSMYSCTSLIQEPFPPDASACASCRAAHGNAGRSATESAIGRWYGGVWSACLASPVLRAVRHPIVINVVVSLMSVGDILA